MYDYIHTCLIARVKYKQHIKPYWNENLSVLKRNKISSYRLWCSLGRPRDALDEAYIRYKQDKKIFAKTLRSLSVNYENQEILDLVRSCEMNRNLFWKKVKRIRSPNKQETISIKDKDGTIKHELKQVLGIWKNHFEQLGTPKMDKAYNEQLFERVNEFVSNEARGNNECQFMGTPFTEDDIEKAFKKINKGKAPGLDGVSIEHLLHSGYSMIRVMTLFYNHIIRIEYIPEIFHTGVQVPLYKGKNTCDLDPNNYRWN